MPDTSSTRTGSVPVSTYVMSRPRAPAHGQQVIDSGAVQQEPEALVLEAVVIPRRKSLDRHAGSGHGQALRAVDDHRRARGEVAHEAPGGLDPRVVCVQRRGPQRAYRRDHDGQRVRKPAARLGTGGPGQQQRSGCEQGQHQVRADENVVRGPGQDERDGRNRRSGPHQRHPARLSLSGAARGDELTQPGHRPGRYRHLAGNPLGQRDAPEPPGPDRGHGDDHHGDHDQIRAEQVQAAQHVLHDADVEIERAEVEVAVEGVVVGPAHVDQYRHQQGRVRHHLAGDPAGG